MVFDLLLQVFERDWTGDRLGTKRMNNNPIEKSLKDLRLSSHDTLKNAESLKASSIPHDCILAVNKTIYSENDEKASISSSIFIHGARGRYLTLPLNLASPIVNFQYFHHISEFNFYHFSKFSSVHGGVCPAAVGTSSLSCTSNIGKSLTTIKYRKSGGKMKFPRIDD